MTQAGACLLHDGLQAFEHVGAGLLARRGRPHRLCIHDHHRAPHAVDAVRVEQPPQLWRLVGVVCQRL